MRKKLMVRVSYKGHDPVTEAKIRQLGGSLGKFEGTGYDLIANRRDLYFVVQSEVRKLEMIRRMHIHGYTTQTTDVSA